MEAREGEYSRRGGVVITARTVRWSRPAPSVRGQRAEETFGHVT
jgi:hypothetical protein